MKNGMLGDGIRQFFGDNRGCMRALFPEMDKKEQDKFFKRLDRELNPHDEGAKLGVREAEELVIRIRKHGGDIEAYLQPAIRRLQGLVHESGELDGFVDDEVFRTIRELTTPETSRIPLVDMSKNDLYRVYRCFHSGLRSVQNGMAEIEAELVRRGDL